MKLFPLSPKLCLFLWSLSSWPAPSMAPVYPLTSLLPIPTSIQLTMLPPWVDQPPLISSGFLPGSHLISLKTLAGFLPPPSTSQSSMHTYTKAIYHRKSSMIFLYEIYSLVLNPSLGPQHLSNNISTPYLGDKVLTDRAPTAQTSLRNSSTSSQILPLHSFSLCCFSN